MLKTMTNKPQMVRISRIQQETPLIKSFSFQMDKIGETADPGQFLMVWIPKMDEIPISISEVEPEITITVKKVGDATEAIHNMQKGDRIGVRGPYGRWFSLRGYYPLIVGGGIGLAPLLFLLRELQGVAKKITIINGARTKAELLFLNKLQNLPKDKFECLFTTDDGSFGQKGFASAIAIEKLDEARYDEVYVCGPEHMICELFSAAEQRDIHMQASLERLMKCGIGLCGQCCVDPIGYRVCVEGPVFGSEMLRKISDFGSCRRDFGGKKTPL
jgi:dihydroorotate dehydrogenase electron transfer subunit